MMNAVRTLRRQKGMESRARRKAKRVEHLTDDNSRRKKLRADTD